MRARRCGSPVACASTLRLGVVALLLCVACDARLPAGAVARIGDRAIAYEEFEEYVAETTGDSAAGLEAAVLVQLFRQFLEEEAFRVLAIDEGLVDRSASRWEAARALLEVEPSEIDAQSLARYREEHRQELQLPERMVARHMLFETRDAAEAARARLLEGVPFGQVVSTAVGAEEIEVAFEDLPEQYAQPLFGLDAGAVSEVLGDAHQHHLFQVLERLPAGEVPDDEVRARATRELEEAAVDRKRLELLQRVRERYHPQVARSRLPFPLPPEENPLP